MNPYKGPYDPTENEFAETRLLRVMWDLSHRILLTPSPAQRTELRALAENVRAQLVKLIEIYEIPSEADYAKAEAARIAPHPLTGCVIAPKGVSS